MLCINGIAKSFGDHCVLKDVSFSVGRGEVYGLIGKNGAGKTTLMNIISGLSAADAGSFFVGEEDHPLKRVGYLPDTGTFRRNFRRSVPTRKSSGRFTTTSTRCSMNRNARTPSCGRKSRKLNTNLNRKSGGTYEREQTI